MTRAQKVAKAQKLRAQGLNHREIAVRLGVSRSSVSIYLTDPDLSRQRARREGYAGTCETCGCPTDGSNGIAEAPRFCRPCAGLEKEVWTREVIIAAIRRWNEHFGKPPVASDWNVALGRSRGFFDRARRYEGGDWPNTRVVQVKFGSWANGIEAAGFPRPLVGVYDRVAA